MQTFGKLIILILVFSVKLDAQKFIFQINKPYLISKEFNSIKYIEEEYNGRIIEYNKNEHFSYNISKFDYPKYDIRLSEYHYNSIKSFDTIYINDQKIGIPDSINYMDNSGGFIDFQPMYDNISLLEFDNPYLNRHYVVWYSMQCCATGKLCNYAVYMIFTFKDGKIIDTQFLPTFGNSGTFNHFVFNKTTHTVMFVEYLFYLNSYDFKTSFPYLYFYDIDKHTLFETYKVLKFNGYYHSNETYLLHKIENN